mgnify:CR=1 FL=1
MHAMAPMPPQSPQPFHSRPRHAPHAARLAAHAASARRNPRRTPHSGHADRGNYNACAHISHRESSETRNTHDPLLLCYVRYLLTAYVVES